MDSFDPIDLDLAPDEQLFRATATEHWNDIALVAGTTSASFPYTHGFADAGDALVAHARAQGFGQDLLLFPALYCYRHAIELLLKEIVHVGRRWAGEPTEVIRSHDLGYLWSKARPAIEAAWPDAEDETYLDRLGSVIGQLADVDADGEQFRYGVDTDGRARLLPEALLRMDLRHAAIVMRKIIGQLGGAVDGMSEGGD